MNTFEFEILSPDGISFKGAASLATFPTMAGMITVLPGHANLVTVLKRGNIEFIADSQTKKITISSGFLEVSGKNVNVVALFAMSADQVSQEVMQKAIDEAKDVKKKRAEIDIEMAEMKLKKDIISLKATALGARKKSM
jgi:F-type H+-transporting ATPase subunit epsilon